MLKKNYIYIYIYIYVYICIFIASMRAEGVCSLACIPTAPRLVSSEEKQAGGPITKATQRLLYR